MQSRLLPELYPSIFQHIPTSTARVINKQAYNVTQTRYERERRHQHLWDINSDMVEGGSSANTFYSWQEFLESEVWNSNSIYDSIPAYWIWLNIDDEDLDFLRESGYEKDELVLVYLQLAPLIPHVIRIFVDKMEEVEVGIWLKHHSFIR